MSKRIFLVLAICMVPLLIGMKQDDGPSQEQGTMSPRDLVVRYAKTRMDLAEVEYEWAKQPTETGQLVMSKAKLERRRSELAVAKEQFKQAVEASTGGLEKVRLCHAEEKLRLAKSDYEAARKSRTLGEYAVKRLKLKYELAKLDLALRKNPENYVTLIEAMQAQIDRQGQEMLALDLRITALENVNR